VPLGKHIKERAKHSTAEKGVRKNGVRNSPAVTKVSKKGGEGGGGASGTVVEMHREPVEGIMVKQFIPLQPLEDPIGAAGGRSQNYSITEW